MPRADAAGDPGGKATAAWTGDCADDDEPGRGEPISALAMDGEPWLLAAELGRSCGGTWPLGSGICDVAGLVNGGADSREVAGRPLAPCGMTGEPLAACRACCAAMCCASIC